MRKKSIILIVATFMVFSAFAAALEASDASFTNGPSATPQVSHGSAAIGNVTIYANGTVSNTSVIGQTGNTYTLLSDINGTLADLRNNSVINGNGFTVNGNGSYAVLMTGVTGVEISNIVVMNASEGIYVYTSNNTILNNVTIVGSPSIGEYMVDVEYSSNVTVQNSNFELNSTATSTYGVYAYLVTSLNLSYNTFSGATNEYFAKVYTVGQFSAWHNTIMSTSSSADGFYIEYGGYATLGYNYVNNTKYGIYEDWEQTLTSTHNQIYNSSYGFYMEDVTTFVSSHDKVLYGSAYGAYLDVGTTALFQYDHMGNASYGLYAEYYGNVNVSNSNISSYSSEGVYVEYSGTLNLYNDQLYAGPSGSYAAGAEYMSGWVNLVRDHIYIPNGDGMYLYYAPEFNVLGSYINATYNIFLDTSVQNSTVSNNTFVTANSGHTVYFYDSNYFNNFAFTNNTVTAPGSSTAEYGIYVHDPSVSSNIVITGNTFINNSYPIYLEQYDYSYPGYGVYIKNNVFVNSSDTISVFYFSNVVVTGNRIINVSDEGIYLYSGATGQSNISNNLIENFHGFGGFSYGIDLEYYYSGNNIISHNTILNGGPMGTSKGIYAYYGVGTWIFGNYVNNTYYAYYVNYNNVLSVFNNVGSNSEYGLYTYYNSNFSYYGNTLSNDNYSLADYYDLLGTVFANTFVDQQTNATSTLYLLYLDEPYGMVTFYHNNFLNETTNSTTANYYSPYESGIYMNAPLPIGGNYYSNYTGTGVNGIGTTPMNVTGSLVDYHPLTSMWTSPTVTFLETGLPMGTPWSVTLGSAMKSSMTGPIVYSPTNGEYMNAAYTVSHVSGYIGSATSGSVYLNGTSKVITVSFTPYTYDVTFKESNLPSGTSWSVTLNGNTRASTGSTISFSEPNGTYSYTIGSVNGYTTTASAGSIQVSGTSQTVSVQFNAVTYTLTVNETGLPSGDTWTVTVGNTTYNTTSDSISVQLVSGTYNVSVSGPSGYTVSLQSSNVSVSNANGIFNVTFSASKGAGTSTNAGSLYLGIGIGAIVGAVAGLVGTMFYTGTGIFRRPGE